MSAPQSLFDAMVQFLRANADVTAAFGDTWNSSLTLLQNNQAGAVAKFWSDYADQCAEPYLVFEEVGESYDYMTATNGVKNFIATGTAICRIYQTDRAAARQLATLVCGALNDPNTVPLQWPGFNGLCQLMELRMMQAAFVPIPDVGPGTPTVFNRVISFEYVYQSQI